MNNPGRVFFMNRLVAMSKVFRCTRNVLHTAPSCPGRRDLSVRKAYYVDANTYVQALDVMKNRFPADVREMGSAEQAFTADEQ